jgi:hypothetical protein
MQETPQQYTQRILGYLEGTEPMEVVAATPRRTSRMIESVSREKLSQRVIPCKWSVTEILAHLADRELVYGYRMRLILEAGSPPIQGTDRDKWARFSAHAGQDPSLSFEAIRSGRESALSLPTE